MIATVLLAHLIPIHCTCYLLPSLLLMLIVLIPGFQCLTQLLKTMPMQFDPAIMFSDQQKKTISIRNLSHNTIKYTKSLTIIESRFFESLVENETLSLLASFDNDPDNGNQPIRRFYLICRGLRRNATKEIINTAVLWFATKFFKKKSPLILESASDEAIATAMYQPNTAQTKLKDLFRCFSRQGIPYSLSKDFNGEGEIQAFFKKNMAIAAKHRPLEYGHKPMASQFDQDEDRKLRTLQMQPYLNYDDCLKSMVWKMGKAFGVRGSIEMCDLTFNKVTVGLMDGLRTVVLHPSEVEKNNALTLQNTERKYQGLQERTMIEDTCNPTCIVKLIHHYRDNLCSPEMVTSNQPFFRRRAPEKELKVCKLCV